MDKVIHLNLQEDNPGRDVVAVEINNQATVQNLVSTYCAKRGIGYNPKIVVCDHKQNVYSQFRTLQSFGVVSGQTLYIGVQKKASNLTDKRWLLFLAITVIIVFLLVIIIMASIYATSGGVIPFDFGIVMDGGSSKTNVILYTWAGDKDNGTGCVEQVGACNKKGGIANVENVSYILPCLNDMKVLVKKASLPHTPLYFAATAGMRLLNISDPAKTEDKLQNLTYLLNDTGMALKSVKVISGNDEGQYAWITANFLKKTLEIPQELNSWKPTTVGALDMGGASVQIAFAVDPKDNSTPGAIPAELYGQTHYVFSQSNLCFGRDEAQRRYRALLVNDPNQPDPVIDPCSPSGYFYNVTGGILFAQTCTENKKFNKWLADDPSLKEKFIKFKGTGEYAICSQKMIGLTNSSSCQEQEFKECFRKPAIIPYPHTFLASASYYYTTKFLNLTTSTFQQYLNGTRSYCSEPYDQMDKNNTYVVDYCFNACYIYEILINGYSFTEATWHNLQFLEKVGKKELGWAMGLMIKATNIIPAKNPSPKFTSIGVFAVCMTVFVSIIVIAVVFAAYYFGRKR